MSLDAPPYVFRDNIDVEDFLRLAATNPVKFQINLSQFNPALSIKLPYVFEGENLRRFKHKKNTKEGFWSKLPLNGSGQSIARENATMMPMMEHGQLVLYLLGGSPLLTGQSNFEIHKINPDK